MIETLNRTRHMIMNYTLPGAKENILAGVKIHTLRADRANRWKPGYKIHHYWGTRFDTEYHLFSKNTVKSVQQVLIVLLTDGPEPEVKITVDRRRLSAEEIHQLAINDGFKSVQELKEWFFKDGTTLWGGKIVHFTTFKY